MNYGFPERVGDLPLVLGTYRGWEISVRPCRGNEEDALSVSASNGRMSFDRAIDCTHAPCGQKLAPPQDYILMNELEGLRKSIDNYETEHTPSSIRDKAVLQIQSWNNERR